MKIAIDAHSLGTKSGGNETFTHQLLRGLADDQSANQYTVFHTADESPEHLSQDQRFTRVLIPRNPLIRLALSLPRHLENLRPDVFHYQYVQPARVRCR